MCGENYVVVGSQKYVTINESMKWCGLTTGAEPIILRSVYLIVKKVKTYRKNEGFELNFHSSMSKYRL